MPFHEKLFSCIASRLTAELKHQPAANGQLLSITLSTPELQLNGLPGLEGNWCFWGRPGGAFYLLGCGEALRVTDSGEGRLDRLTATFEAFCDNWICCDPDSTGVEPRFFTLFAFSEDDPMESGWRSLPNTALFLPELLLHQKGNNSALSFSTRLDNDKSHAEIIDQWLNRLRQICTGLETSREPPGQKSTLARTSAQPSDLAWIQLVSRAKSAISQGDMEKVVPARSIKIKAQRKLKPGQLMGTLKCLYPNSMLFSVCLDGPVFVAATPERLASRTGDHITCDAIGGTISRAPDEALDKELGKMLLTDPKAAHEHRLVVTDIEQKLSGLCNRVTLPKGPSLLRLRHIQHLCTEIKGQLKPGTTLLEVAAEIHPTPAVNGVPTAQAKAWLAKHEPAFRGWYTGAAGWIDRKGDGELGVLLRCALLDGDKAELFAGAGITEASDPEAELRETELKFATMLEALENA